MAKKNQTTTENATPAEKTAKGPTWRIGLFRNDHGRLCTVYTRAYGTPMPYEARRVGDRMILRTGKYEGMKYSEARQLLLAEAKAAGLVDEPVEKSQAEPAAAEPAEAEAPKAKPRAKKAGKAGKATAPAK